MEITWKQADFAKFEVNLKNMSFTWKGVSEGSAREVTLVPYASSNGKKVKGKQMPSKGLPPPVAPPAGKKEEEKEKADDKDEDGDDTITTMLFLAELCGIDSQLYSSVEDADDDQQQQQQQGGDDDQEDDDAGGAAFCGGGD